ncbi:MAG TPA: hypothetical protein VN131_06075, partial [Mobilitalea sp.]|nr:hypothetical protein [Mobilitalea sp.]
LRADMEFDEENEVYVVSVPADMEKQAKKLYQAFYFSEREHLETETKGHSSSTIKKNYSISGDDEEIDELEGAVSTASSDEGKPGDFETKEAYDSENNPDTYDKAEDVEEDTEELKEEEDKVDVFNPSDEPAAYVMKSDQYKDLSATVWIFLFFGIGGLAVIVLDIAGIIHFNLGWMANVIMGALFLFFIYVGISTQSKAKKIQSEIDAENNLTEKINEWLKANITEDFLAEHHNDQISDELNYLKIADTIKEMLIKEFGEQNRAYLDRLIDEYYGRNFDKEVDSEEI